MADPVEAPDDWAFGSGGFAKIYGERLANSSILETAPASRWVFVFMMAQADSRAATGAPRCRPSPGLPTCRWRRPRKPFKNSRGQTLTPPTRRTRVAGSSGSLGLGDSEPPSVPRLPHEEADRGRGAEGEERAKEKAPEERGEVPPAPSPPCDMSHDVTATPRDGSPDVRRKTADGTTNGNGPSAAAASASPAPAQLDLEGHDDGNGARKKTPKDTTRPKALAVIPAPSWSKEAATAWDARFGLGSAPAGRIGRPCLPGQGHGWDKVKQAWQRYLVEKETEYVSPQDFASKFGAGRGRRPRLGRAVRLWASR